MAYWWLLQPPTVKAQVTIVHGTGDNAFFPFAELLKSLLHKEVSVFLFDLDGHGRQSTTFFDERTITSAIESAWANASTTLPHHIIGFSLGAALTLQAIRSGGINPGSQVLIAPPLHVKGSVGDFLPEIKTALSPRFWAEKTGTKGWGRLPAFGPFRRDRFPIRLHDPSESYPTRIKRAINRCHLERTRDIAVPTLVIYGEHDRISEPRPREIWRQIAPKSTTITIRDAAHFVLPDHPETVARITSWYASDCQLF